MQRDIGVYVRQYRFQLLADDEAFVWSGHVASPSIEGKHQHSITANLWFSHGTTHKQPVNTGDKLTGRLWYAHGLFKWRWVRGENGIEAICGGCFYAATVCGQSCSSGGVRRF